MNWTGKFIPRRETVDRLLREKQEEEQRELDEYTEWELEKLEQQKIEREIEDE